MVWALIGAAWGWDLDVGPLLDLGSEPQAFAVAADAAGPWIALGGATGTRVIAPDGSPLGADPLWSMSLGWDGAALVACAAGGVARVPWSAGALGEVAWISEQGCDAVAPGGEAVLRFPDVWRVAGGLEVDPSLSGDAYAFTRGAFGVVSTSAILTDAGSIPFTGPLDAGARAGGMWWGHGPDGWRSEQGHALSGGPTAAVGDIDGDGVGDLVVVDGGAFDAFVAVWSSLDGSIRRWPIGPEPDHIAVLALGDAACASVLWSQGASMSRLDPIGCQGDADGDGVRSEDGDCDDGDPSIHPGAAETCDAVDRNCDGALGDLPFELSGPNTADEGDVVTVEVDFLCEALPPGSRPELTSEPPGACSFSGADLLCSLPDQGELVVSLTPPDAPGFGVSHAIAFANVAPVLDTSELRLEPRSSTSTRLQATDVDPITWTLLDGPSWVTLDPDGALHAETRGRSSRRIRVRLDDGDGGVTDGEILLRVRRPRRGCFELEASCATSRGGSLGGLIALALVALRRRRP